MDVLWDSLPKARWDRFATEADAALPQDWAYGEAMASLGAEVLRAMVRDGERLIALAQFTRRRFAGLLECALCTRGPVWSDVRGDDEKAAVYRALRRTLPSTRPGLTLFTPDADDAASLKTARLNQVMTGGAAAVLNIGADLSAIRAGMHGKWRNRLRAAEGADLRVRANGVKPADYEWLLKAESAQRTRRRYRALPTAFVSAYRAARGRREALHVLRADHKGDADAAMLFLRHGRTATYHIGWTSADGRAASAHNLLLWKAIEELKAAGVKRLDLGGVDTDRSPGVARFKLGVGARPTLMCGTYA